MRKDRNIFTGDFKATPYWWDAAPPESYRDPLPEQADVVIVGSGYCGLSAAVELARNGTDVVVLDAAEIGSGASTRSGGMVSSGQKLVVGGAIKGVPPDLFERMIEDSIASFQHIQDLIGVEKLDADLTISGRFFGAHTPRAYDDLRRMGNVLHEKTGVTVHEVPRGRQREAIGSDHYYGGIVIDEYGGLHPGKYHRALRDLAASSGAVLRSHARVRRISPSGAGFAVDTSRGVIQASRVIVTTNGYTDEATPDLQRRVVPARSYQIATERLEPDLMAELIPGGRMISDTKRDLFYTRPSPDGTRILFGTRPGIFEVSDEAAAGVLHSRMCEVWPQLAGRRISHVWSGYVGMTFDKTAHMGERDGIVHAVGCNGNGVALMTYLGHRTALKLLGRQNRPCAFDREAFPSHPLYRGKAWFLPVVGGWYRIRDRMDRLAAMI
jgi:glycine/D-amino acid oxidase-like deaminating enzyme